MTYWPPPHRTVAASSLGKTAAQQHLCAQRQCAGGEQFGAALGQVDGCLPETAPVRWGGRE